MKKNQLVIISSVIAFFALIFIWIVLKKEDPTVSMKEEQKIIHIPVKRVLNETKDIQITSYGQVTSNAEIDVAFEVQGRLEKGFTYLKPGVRFSQGQVLYRVNNEEAFYTLSSRKTQLANLVVGILPDIELDFPSEKKKWAQFLEEIQPNKFLPELPNIASSKERMFLTSRGILSEYYLIKSSESRMAKYTYVAPFNGTVLETFAEPGAIANPGARVARIAKTNDFEVKVPISLKQLKYYQSEGSITFYNADGEKVGRGSISRISDVINQQTQSVVVYCSIQPEQHQKIFTGMYLNVSINQRAPVRSITVPLMAVNKNKVGVLKQESVVDRIITVVGSKPDSLYISGLQDGEMVVLERVEINKKGKIFKGITQ